MRTAGATPSAIRTKLDRALGSASAEGEVADIKPGTVGELVARTLRLNALCLPATTSRLRTGAPVVHETRVAVRRLRSTLRIFGDVVDAGSAEELER